MIRVLAGCIRRGGKQMRSAPAGGGKLSGGRRGVNLRNLVVPLVAAVLVGGCIRAPRALREVPAGEWTQRLGNALHAPFIDEHVPDNVEVRWNEGLGRGVPSTAIIADELIISVISGGGLVTASARTGDRFWSRRFDGAIAGPVLRTGQRIYFATQHRNGSVYAVDLERGRRLWTRRLGASAAAEPALADGRLYVATQRGELLAIDTANGGVLWRARIGRATHEPPLVIADRLLVPSRDSLIAVRRSDGTVLGRQQIAGMPSAPIAVRGDTLVIAMHPGIVAAYVDGGSREVWRHSFPTPVLAAPVITDDGVYVLTREGEVHLLRPYSLQRIAALNAAVTESLTVTANGILVGTLDGRIVYLRRDGTTVWEERVNGSVRAPAAVSDSAVYVGTLTGRMVKLIAGTAE